ncbi:dihydrodipicolinate synthase family protein [Thermoanaerobacteraceae bacterium SP2]|nr:dihydrodipicolinate synthase family protein [Thermoanaerobacteraceae bacterium SP2]
MVRNSIGGKAMKIDTIREKLEHSFFPAVPIPFDRSGKIHETAQEQYVKYMDKQPITGVAVWAHTGRGLLITREQREYIFKSWRAGLSREKIIICGVGARTVKDLTEEKFIKNTLEMGIHAKDLGADAILAYPPTYYRGKEYMDKKIIDYHKKIAEIGLPIILFYLYDEAGGISYSQKVLEQLFSIENVVGIKMATLDSIVTYQDVSKLILDKFPHIKLITGEDRMFGYTIARGAAGALVGLGSACQKLQWEMMDSFFRRDYEDFVKLMLDVDRLAECTFIDPMEGYIERMLYILSLQGIIPEDAVNDPYGPGLKQQDKEEIRKILQELHLY